MMARFKSVVWTVLPRILFDLIYCMHSEAGGYRELAESVVLGVLYWVDAFILQCAKRRARFSLKNSMKIFSLSCRAPSADKKLTTLHRKL
jgi:hypothetical protein